MINGSNVFDQFPIPGLILSIRDILENALFESLREFQIEGKALIIEIIRNNLDLLANPGKFIQSLFRNLSFPSHLKPYYLKTHRFKETSMRGRC